MTVEINDRNISANVAVLFQHAGMISQNLVVPKSSTAKFANTKREYIQVVRQKCEPDISAEMDSEMPR